jgi:hypothetical protein
MSVCMPNAAEFAPPDHAEEAAVELADRVGKHRTRLMAGPRAIKGQARIAANMLVETQYQSPDMLHHRCRAVSTHIAYGDPELVRRGQIDVVGTGAGDGHEF